MKNVFLRVLTFSSFFFKFLFQVFFVLIFFQFFSQFFFSFFLRFHRTRMTFSHLQELRHVHGGDKDRDKDRDNMRKSFKTPYYHVYLSCLLTTITLSTVESSLWELNPMGTAWEGLNYGCWCNVGANYDFSEFQKGSGQTVDRMDEICKNHHDDYDQALRNSAKEGVFCKPDDKIYDAGDNPGLVLQGSWADARKNCVKVNKGDMVCGLM